MNDTPPDGPDTPQKVDPQLDPNFGPVVLETQQETQPVTVKFRWSEDLKPLEACWADNPADVLRKRCDQLLKRCEEIEAVITKLLIK